MEPSGSKPRIRNLPIKLFLVFVGLFAILALPYGRAGASFSEPAAIVKSEPPPLPSSFYGSVSLSGQTAPAGTQVSAWINDIKYAETTTFLVNGNAVYRLDVPGDIPDTPEVEGGTNGDAIVFQVDGFDADQTGIWQTGTFVELNLTATPPALPPVAQDQNVTTNEDVPLGVTLTAFDPNNDPLTFSVVSGPSNGTLSGTPPNLTYTPNANYNGPDSFTFLANDGTFDSNVATVSITVNAVNDPPALTPIPDQVIDEGTTHTLFIFARDPDGDPITLSASSLPAFASFTDDGNGKGRLALAPGFTDAGVYPGISVSASDGSLTDTEIFTLTVNDAEPVPQARFSVGKGMNVAQLTDGASIADFSSVQSTATSVQPERAIDNNAASSWVTANGQVSDQWIKVALTAGEPHVVDRVILRGSSNNSGMKDFEVRISNSGSDDADFVAIISDTLPQDDENHEYTFAPLQARFVQLFVKNNWGNSTNLRVSHFQVWTRDRQGGIVSLREGPRSSVTAFSSQLSDANSAENMLDDSFATRWSSANGQTTNQWVKVRLGGGLIYTIDRIRLRSSIAAEAVRDFEIRVSSTTDDDAAFTTIFEGTAANTTEEQEFVFDAPTQARFVQLFIKNNQGNNTRTSVNTFQVLTPDGANVARRDGVGAFALAASSQSSSSTGPEMAIDFASNTRWQTASGQVSDQWFKVRLIEGAPYLINRVRIDAPAGTASPREFQLLVSTNSLDDADFVPILTANLPNDGLAHWFSFPPTQAKYIQLFINNNYGSTNSIQVENFQVYSPELGGAAVPFDDFSEVFEGTITDWLWDFGDGETSTEQHPQHSYATPGNYDVSLTVTADNGLTGTTTMNYSVLIPPTADFTWTPIIPNEGQTTNFVDNSSDVDGSAIGWLWQFTHTANQPTTQNANTAFPDNGDHVVALTVTDSQLLHSTLTQTVSVLNVPPTVNAGPDRTLVWGRDWTLTSTLSDAGAADRPSLLCDWDFGDGQTEQVINCNSSTARVAHAYANPGVYTATLTVTDKDGASASDSLLATVTKREALLINYSLLSQGTGQAEVKAGLFDLSVWGTSMEGKAVSFNTASQSVPATVDANGVAAALLDVHVGQSISVTTTLEGDDFYIDTSDVDELTAAPTLPSGDIVFIIDESGSMVDDQNEVRARVNDMVDQLNHSMDFRLGLVGFATSRADAPPNVGYIHTPLTADVDLFKEKLDELKTSFGRAFGFNATVLAMSEAMNYRNGAGACAILITDSGGAEANPTAEAPETREDAIAALESRNAPFFGIVNLLDPQIRENYGPDPGSLAAESGGEVFALQEFRGNPGAVLAGVIDNCAQQIIARTAPDLSVDKNDGKTLVSPGEVLTYTLTISNTSIQEATGVIITDTLPAHTIFLSASEGGSHQGGLVTWPTFDLAPFDTITRTLTLQLDDPFPTGVDTITNTVTVIDDGSNGVDPNLDNNTAFDVDSVLRVVAAPDLAITKDNNQINVLPGQALLYTLTVDNLGDQDATAVVITDTLPAQAGFIAASNGGGHANGVVIWPAFDLAAGASITRTVSVLIDDSIPAGVDVITNTAAVADDGSLGADPNPDNNLASDSDILQAAPDLALAKESNQPVALPGGPLSYTLTADNRGTQDATGVVIADTVPAHTAFDAAASTSGWDCADSSPAGTVCSLEIGDLAVGSNQAVEFAVTVDAQLPGDLAAITNTASTGDDGSNGPDLNPADNIASATTPVNRPPVAVDDTFTVLEDSGDNVLDVLANDADPDGDTLSIVSVTQPSHGTTSLNPDNTISYAPAQDFNGADAFQYTIADSHGLTATASVTISVLPVNDPPLAVDDEAATPEDTSVVISVLDNDSDIDGDTLSVIDATQPANGMVVINLDNSVTYTPEADFNGTDAFAYTISDGNGGTDTAVVTVTVQPVNDPPVAVDDEATTEENIAVTVDVLANDSDVDGDALSVVSTSQPANGTLVINPDNTITYTPQDGFTGVDSFTYTIDDGNGGTDTATVTVTVTPAPVVACELYPIALHVDTLAGVAEGDLVEDIFNGAQPGNFGWLTWTGNNSVPTLATSLTPPGDSHTYTNPSDPNDHLVSIGDRVQGRPAVANASSVRNALDLLKRIDIVVPIWNAVEMSGANTNYRVIDFANVRLIDYQLPGTNQISVRFLGIVSCDDN